MRYLIIIFSFITSQILSQSQLARLAPHIISVNGKYGIMDENGKTVVLPENDTIIPSIKYYLSLTVKKINPIFFIKKDNKFAFAYQIDMDTAYDYFDFPKEKIRWYTSEFLYDAIEEVTGWIDGFDSPSRNAFNPSMFVTLKYKCKGKWGLIYIPFNQSYDYFLGEKTIEPAYLGSCIKTEAICDSIGKRHRDRLYDVKINGKWVIWRIIAYNKWINYLYPEYFDSPPETVGDPRSYGGEFFKPFYRLVKKEGKWGLIRIKKNTTEIEYIIPCQYDELEYNVKGLVTCKKANEKKVTFYNIEPHYKLDEVSYTYFELPYTNKKIIRDNYVIEFDTALSRAPYYQKKYAVVGLGGYNSSIEYKKASELYFYDLKKQILKAVFKDTASWYSVYQTNLGIIVRKRTALGSKNLYEYIDLESNDVKFTLQFDTTTLVINYVEGRTREYELENAFNCKSKIEADGSYVRNECDIKQKLQINLETRIVLADKNGKKIRGYYDFVNKKYVRKKPRYQLRCN